MAGRAHIANWLVAAAALAGCFGVHPRNARYTCAAAADCPDGYDCATDHTCWRRGEQPEAALALVPPSAAMRSGESQSFQANAAVSWRIEEGDAGGTITSDGRYRAPAQPGRYHVVASAGSRSATAAVDVRGWSLELLAGGPGGPGASDGDWSQARLSTTVGLVSDGADHLYFGDRDSFTIRQATLSTGLIETLAGAPRLPGSADGIGAAARFQSISSLALDGAGHLYISDSGDSRIRVLDLASRRVSHVAGAADQPGASDGDAASARFDYPFGIAFAADGTLYAADAGNGWIRRLALTAPGGPAAAVTTLRDGDGAPLPFSWPRALAFDGSGAALYVAHDGAIEQVTLATPPLRTLVADGVNGTPRFAGIVSLALDASGRLYMSDEVSPFSVSRLVPATGAIIPVLDYPYGASPPTLLWDRDKTWVGDEAVIGVLDQLFEDELGVVSARFGRAAQRRFVDAEGDRYGIGVNARFATPMSIAYDGAGAVYVLNHGNFNIRKVDLGSGDVTTPFALQGDSSRKPPYGLSYDGHGKLFVAEDATHNSIVTYYNTASALYDVGVAYATDQQTGLLSALTADDAGNLYAGNQHTIIRIALGAGGSAVTTVAGTPGVAGTSDTSDGGARFHDIHALGWDRAGFLYVADGNAIRRVALADGVTVTLAGDPVEVAHRDGVGREARFGFPNALAVGPGGTLFISDSLYATVRRLDLDSGAVTTWVGRPSVAAVLPGALPAAVNLPGGLAVTTSGDLILSDVNENVLLRVR